MRNWWTSFNLFRNISQFHQLHMLKVSKNNWVSCRKKSRNLPNPQIFALQNKQTRGGVLLCKYWCRSHRQGQSQSRYASYSSQTERVGKWPKNSLVCSTGTFANRIQSHVARNTAVLNWVWIGGRNSKTSPELPRNSRENKSVLCRQTVVPQKALPVEHISFTYHPPQHFCPEKQAKSSFILMTTDMSLVACFPAWGALSLRFLSSHGTTLMTYENVWRKVVWRAQPKPKGKRKNVDRPPSSLYLQSWVWDSGSGSGYQPR